MFRVALLFYFTIRCIIKPFFFLMLPFVSFLKERKTLEEQFPLPSTNHFDLIIHISSEGELEQANFLIQTYLKQSKNVLILFTSPSLKERLIKREEDKFSIAALPLWKGLGHLKNYTCDLFIMVRYDFFPELLAMAKNNYSLLLSATYKNKQGSFKLSFQDFCIGHFDKVFSASLKDKHFIKERLGVEAPSFEFRIPQIYQRLSHENELLERKAYALYTNWIDSVEKKKRLIIGSAWESDLGFLGDSGLIEQIKKGEFILSIAPHKLDQAFILNIQSKIKEITGLEAFILNEDSKLIPDNNIVICCLKGVLLESYLHFQFVYIGGGFARSVHSVLEPYCAGAKVYCGPKVHRSTEVDYIRGEGEESLEVLKDSNELEELFQIIQNDSTDPMDRIDQLRLLVEQGEGLAKDLIQRPKC